MSPKPQEAVRAHVLIVEDNDLNRKLAQEILHLHGYATATAVSGEEAVELACRQAFDLILMDIQLPEMDGLEATRLLKSKPPTRDVPVLAVSALARSEDRERAMQAGCDGYLTKPYGIKALVQAIELALSARRASPDSGLASSQAS